MKVIIICLLAGAIISSCTAQRERRKTRQKHGLMPSAERYNFFDMDLFQALNMMETEENILVSPLSVKAVLGMVMEGARGDTAEEIRLALRLPNDRKEAREAFGRWLKSLQTQKSTNTLEMANHLFVSQKLHLDNKYRSMLQQAYLADVTPVDFNAKEQTARLVNTWANNATRGLIPELLSAKDVPSKGKMLLTNAVYFKGTWASPFDPERTTVKCFYRGGTDVCHPTYMMAHTGTFNYAYISTLDAQAVDIPYEDGKYSMLLVLPRGRKGIQQLGRDMVHVHHEHILQQLQPKELFLLMPRFQMDYHEDLVTALTKLHVTEVFSPQADLSGISNESLSVSQVFHSAKILVNEEGSEAAAATGALFVPLIGNSATNFVAEHPFFFSIRDTATGSILFAGRVSHPEEANKEAALLPEGMEALAQGPEFPLTIMTVPPPLIDSASMERQPASRKPVRGGPVPPTSRPGGFHDQNVGLDRTQSAGVNPIDLVAASSNFPYATPPPPLVINDLTLGSSTPSKTTFPKPLSTTPPPLLRDVSSYSTNANTIPQPTISSEPTNIKRDILYTSMGSEEQIIYNGRLVPRARWSASPEYSNIHFYRYADNNGKGNTYSTHSFKYLRTRTSGAPDKISFII